MTSQDLFVFTARFTTVALIKKSVYLKLDDGVLIYINISGGNRVLSKLTGDKYHSWLILLPASITFKGKVIFCMFHHRWKHRWSKNPNTVTNDSVTVNKFLQASLLVGAVETSVSPWREQPVGLIGAFLKTVYHHWGVVERAAINDEIIYHPHLLLLA